MMGFKLDPKGTREPLQVSSGGGLRSDLQSDYSSHLEFCMHLLSTYCTPGPQGMIPHKIRIALSQVGKQRDTECAHRLPSQLCVMQSMGSALGSEDPGFKSQLCHFPATWPSVSFPFLSLSSLMDGTRWSMPSCHHVSNA